MPCAAGELCKLADVELIAPNGRACGHECRGGCGGKLHGICSEVEDPDGDSPTHRICHTCISKRSLSNPAKCKRGQGSQGFVLPGAATKKSRASGATKPRKRLNTAILNALSVGVKEAAEGGGVQDSEMCEVLSHLGIVPGMPTIPPAMEAVESWVELE